MRPWKLPRASKKKRSAFEVGKDCHGLGGTMNLLALVANHGYATVMVILFCASCGLPLPLSVALLMAGAAAHGGALNLGLVILYAWSAALLGDTIMSLGGRFTGWWLLAGICRISINPESCIFGSANSFYRRGPKALLF